MIKYPGHSTKSIHALREGAYKEGHLDCFLGLAQIFRYGAEFQAEDGIEQRRPNRAFAKIYFNQIIQIKDQKPEASITPTEKLIVRQAHHELACIHLEKAKDAKSPEKQGLLRQAAHNFLNAVKLGHALSAHPLSEMYAHGIGVQQSMEKAKKLEQAYTNYVSRKIYQAQKNRGLAPKAVDLVAKANATKPQIPPLVMPKIVHQQANINTSTAARTRRTMPKRRPRIIREEVIAKMQAPNSTTRKDDAEDRALLRRFSKALDLNASLKTLKRSAQQAFTRSATAINTWMHKHKALNHPSGI